MILLTGVSGKKDGLSPGGDSNPFGVASARATGVKMMPRAEINNKVSKSK